MKPAATLLGAMVGGPALQLRCLVGAIAGASVVGSSAGLPLTATAMLALLAAGASLLVVPTLFGWYLLGRIRERYGGERETEVRRWLRSPWQVPSDDVAQALILVNRRRRNLGDGRPTQWWVHPGSLVIGGFGAVLAALLAAGLEVAEEGRWGLGLTALGAFACATFGAELARRGYSVRNKDPRRRRATWAMTMVAALGAALVVWAVRQATH